jgi:hypothetical protein
MNLLLNPSALTSTVETSPELTPNNQNLEAASKSNLSSKPEEVAVKHTATSGKEKERKSHSLEPVEKLEANSTTAKGKYSRKNVDFNVIYNRTLKDSQHNIPDKTSHYQTQELNYNIPNKRRKTCDERIINLQDNGFRSSAISREDLESIVAIPMPSRILRPRDTETKARMLPKSSQTLVFEMPSATAIPQIESSKVIENLTLLYEGLPENVKTAFEFPSLHVFGTHAETVGTFVNRFLNFDLISNLNIEKCKRSAEFQLTQVGKDETPYIFFKNRKWYNKDDIHQLSRLFFEELSVESTQPVILKTALTSVLLPIQTLKLTFVKTTCQSKLYELICPIFAANNIMLFLQKDYDHDASIVDLLERMDRSETHVLIRRECKQSQPNRKNKLKFPDASDLKSNKSSCNDSDNEEEKTKDIQKIDLDPLKSWSVEDHDLSKDTVSDSPERKKKPVQNAEKTEFYEDTLAKARTLLLSYIAQKLKINYKLFRSYYAECKTKLDNAGGWKKTNILQKLDQVLKRTNFAQDLLQNTLTGSHLLTSSNSKAQGIAYVQFLLSSYLKDVNSLTYVSINPMELVATYGNISQAISVKSKALLESKDKLTKLLLNTIRLHISQLISHTVEIVFLDNEKMLTFLVEVINDSLAKCVDKTEEFLKQGDELVMFEFENQGTLTSGCTNLNHLTEAYPNLFNAYYSSKPERLESFSRKIQVNISEQSSNPFKNDSKFELNAQEIQQVEKTFSKLGSKFRQHWESIVPSAVMVQIIQKFTKSIPNLISEKLLTSDNSVKFLEELTVSENSEKLDSIKNNLSKTMAVLMILDDFLIVS